MWIILVNPGRACFSSATGRWISLFMIVFCWFGNGKGQRHGGWPSIGWMLGLSGLLDHGQHFLLVDDEIRFKVSAQDERRSQRESHRLRGVPSHLSTEFCCG